jgi:F-type H+-transporting ATPase subunit b
MDIQTLLHEPRFWYSVAFVLFFVLFGSRIWRPLAAMLDNRAVMVRAELDGAARLRREAEAMLAEARQEREAAMDDARRMIENAKVEAQRIAEAAKREGDLVAARRERMAHDRIAASERAAVTEIRMIAAEIATQAARAVVADSLGAEGDAALIDRAIAGLPAAFATRIAA